MTARVLAALVVLISFATARTAGAEVDTDGFPAVTGRPAGTATGVLVDYGVGMHGGALSIRDRRGTTRTFAIAANGVYADGRLIVCDLPPRPGHPAPSGECTSWPHGIVLGRTPVRVTYWHDARGREITNRIHTIVR